MSSVERETEGEGEWKRGLILAVLSAVCVWCRARMEAIEDEIHLNREKSKAEAALYHKVGIPLLAALM